MKLTLESTAEFVLMSGVATRLWIGTTDSGARVRALIAAVAIDESEDSTELERELFEIPPPAFHERAR